MIFVKNPEPFGQDAPVMKGRVAIYVGDDGKVYRKDDDGVSTRMTADEALPYLVMALSSRGFS